MRANLNKLIFNAQLVTIVEVLNAGVDINAKGGLQIALYTKDAGIVFIDITAGFLKTMLGDALKGLNASKTEEQVYKIVIDQLKTTLKDAAIDYTPEMFVKNDESYFYFVIDGDTYDEDQDGYLCKCGMGKQCPDEFFKIIEFTNKRW